MVLGISVLAFQFAFFPVGGARIARRLAGNTNDFKRGEGKAPKEAFPARQNKTVGRPAMAVAL